MKINFKQFIVPHFWKKFFIMMTGIFFMGFFLSFLLDVSWGTDPFSYQNTNISYRLRNAFGPFWSFGNFQLILNLIMLILVIVLDRHLIGLGTLANMVLIGYISDFFRNHVWHPYFPMEIYTSADLLWAKILVFILALGGFVIAAAVYMNTDMGLSPYDGLSFIISHKLKKIPFAVTRIIYDLTGVTIGLLACIGSDLSRNQILSPLIGSIALSLTLGPMITAVGKIMKKILFKDEVEKPSTEENNSIEENKSKQ